MIGFADESVVAVVSDQRSLLRFVHIETGAEIKRFDLGGTRYFQVYPEKKTVLVFGGGQVLQVKAPDFELRPHPVSGHEIGGNSRVGMLFGGVVLTKDGFIMTNPVGTARFFTGHGDDPVERLRMFAFGTDAIWSVPEGYYAGSRDTLRNLAFAVGLRAYPPTQFDLRFNRPDIVYEVMGGVPTGVIDSYRRGYERRVRRHGLDPAGDLSSLDLPELKVNKALPLKSKKRKLTAKVSASSAHGLSHVQVYINEVPVLGGNGHAVSGKSVEAELTFELGAGRNKVQFSAFDSRGLESLRESFEVTLSGRPPKPDLYLLAIGVSDYTTDAYDLDYAAKDASDLATFFNKRKGVFNKVHVKTLRNGEVTKDGVKKGRSFFEKARTDDHVMLFVAGHGLLDDDLTYFFATHDVDFAKPAQNGLPFDDLEGLLDGLNSRHKLLLMDTCHSGEVDDDDLVVASSEGVKARPVGARGFRKLERKKLGMDLTEQVLSEVFAELRRGSGAAVLTSAGAGELAFESAEWKNGVFTLAVLEGLGGDADTSKDKTVTVSELTSFVIERVRGLTGGLQRPTARRPVLV